MNGYDSVQLRTRTRTHTHTCTRTHTHSHSHAITPQVSAVTSALHPARAASHAAHPHTTAPCTGGAERRGARRLFSVRYRYHLVPDRTLTSIFFFFGSCCSDGRCCAVRDEQLSRHRDGDAVGPPSRLLVLRVSSRRTARGRHRGRRGGDGVLLAPAPAAAITPASVSAIIRGGRRRPRAARCARCRWQRRRSRPPPSTPLAPPPCFRFSELLVTAHLKIQCTPGSALLIR